MSKKKSPIILLMVTAEGGKRDELIKIFKSQKVKQYMSFMGEGTSASTILDIFGFGVSNVDFVWGLVNEEKRPRIFYLIKKNLGFDKADKGVAWTVPISAMSSDTLELLGVR